MTLDLVLPIRADVPGRSGELERVTNGLLPSLIRTTYHSFASTFFVICPQHDETVVRAALAQFHQFNFQFLTDETLLPECGFDPAACDSIPGWHRQQILKLATTSKSTSRLALVLDADIVAVNSVIPDIRQGGAVPYQPMGVAVFRHWFEASAKVLGVNFNLFSDAQLDQAMGVTPEFLSPGIVRQLIARLTSRACDERWGPYLMSHVIGYENTWTEYSLYWVFYLTLTAPEIIYKTHSLYRFIEDPSALDNFLELTPQSFAVLQSTKITTNQCGKIYDMLRVQKSRAS